MQNVLLLRIFQSLEKSLNVVVDDLTDNHSSGRKLQERRNSSRHDKSGPKDLQMLLQIIKGAVNDQQAIFTKASLEVPHEQSVLRKLSPSFGVIKEMRNCFAHSKSFPLHKLRQVLDASKQVLAAFQHYPVCEAELLKVNATAAVFRRYQRQESKTSAELQSQPSVGLAHAALSNGQSLARSWQFSSFPQIFVGREPLLKEISSFVTASISTSSQSPASVLLHGPHGVGKTSLMRMVAMRLRSTFSRQYCFQATTKEALLGDISFLLSCDSSETSCRSSLAHLHNDLENGKLLLMFDDVRDPKFVMSLLPSTPCCTLFTSVTDIFVEG